MCNLSDIIEERGIQKGIQIGIQEGIQQGRLETIYELVQSGEFTLEQIAKGLDIPVEKLKADMEAENF